MSETCRVMIVDDQEDFRQWARALLAEEDDFQVIAEASSGSEAIDLVNQVAPVLVLMDVQMPGMNGFEATRTILERHPDAAVVLTSMFENKEFPRMADEAGALAFLSKKALSAGALRRSLEMRSAGLSAV